ncbi:hypothetical protein D3870_09275 [Noviherbaspirillum cavernae]|uniref:Proline-rich protein n=2 Tax=Noviherbaspirillum cavernae TaxID=2320862 RepID=A0A418X145_9BURK|nr:hypothetical protein D3870_09275 [Noviherbaspirillum cavernae]
MTNSVFDKTEKGREEIATRKHHLAHRLRTLLLLFDGKHATEDILEKVSGIGLNHANIGELLAEGFIHITQTGAQESAETPTPQPPAQQQPEPHAGRTLANGESQFEAIYHFYTETIKSTIGLRGYALQLKVERAGSLDEFRALRQQYLEAVLKAKGSETAKALKMRLDEVLYLGESAPPLTTIAGL